MNHAAYTPGTRKHAPDSPIKDLQIDMSYSLNFVKGGYIGECLGNYSSIRLMKGD